MPRNYQVIHQRFLLHKLESARGATIDELATALPPDYSRHARTIRRDLEALEVAFPLLIERVNGQTRWRLMDGYRNIPRLAFSSTELMSLVISRDLMKPLEGTHIKASLDSALDKATAALPPEGAAYVKQMQGYLTIGLGPHKVYRQHRETIERLAHAVSNKRTVQMRYYSASRRATTRREVDPYRLWYAAGALYLVAYCHLRHDVRLFAVERIRSLAVTQRPCQMPLGFDLESYVQ